MAKAIDGRPGENATRRKYGYECRHPIHGIRDSMNAVIRRHAFRLRRLRLSSSGQWIDGLRSWRWRLRGSRISVFLLGFYQRLRLVPDPFVTFVQQAFSKHRYHRHFGTGMVEPAIGLGNVAMRNGATRAACRLPRAGVALICNSRGTGIT